ncbi:MAG: S1/P1 nuclease [Sphingobacteriaceae bacterium]|nr:S1/P1 nuclease [Sphingobacteriaceae bacterium]
MKTSLLNKLLVFGLLLYLPSQSLAWGMLGHRVVGQIAETHLNPKTKLALKAILGNESLAMGSNWADFVKSDKSYDYLYNWHFVNFAAGLSSADINGLLKADTAVNAFTKINFLVNELKKKNLPKAQKIMYIRLLVHIIGDVHQPMHTGRAEDKGGNDVKLTWFGKSSNLHSVWDTELVESQQLSYTEYTQAINFCSAKQKADWQQAPINAWITETYGMAQTIYSGVTLGDKLSYRYIYDNLNTVNTQLLKGGIRLAGVLNQIFGS